MITIIVTIACFIIGCLFEISAVKIKDYSFVLISTCFFICSIAGGFTYSYTRPQAIDVYRDKTVLEITYRDSIPVDSMVVFKNNKNRYGIK